MSKAFERLMSKGYRPGRNYAHHLLHHWSPTEDERIERDRVVAIHLAGIASRRNEYRISNPRAPRARLASVI